MKGRILDYSIQNNSGAISGADGNRYQFSGSDWNDSDPPQRGMAVDFEPVGDRATQVYRDVDVAVASHSAGGQGGNRSFGVTCLQCGANVIPEGAINWLLFIVFLLLCCPAAVIYLLVQAGKPKKCPVCNGTNFETPS